MDQSVLKNVKILIGEKTAAKLIDIKPQTMQAWRHKGIGPKYVKISRRCVKYDPCDIEEWISKKRVNPENEG